jgi:hypothetical protein
MPQVYYFHGLFLDGVVKPDGKRVVDYAWCGWRLMRALQA